MLKKVVSAGWRMLALLLIWLPVCALAAPGPDIKISAAPSPATLKTLRQADSLFETGAYTAALPYYRQLVWEKKQVSPRVLLRSAFTQQQLGHYPATLLYLSLAQARQPRLSTWRQLTALAQQHRLVGYPDTWQQELRVRVQRYYYSGLQVLLLGAVVWAVWLLLRRRPRPGRLLWTAYGAYVVLTGAYLHLLRPTPVGLVARPGTVLMAGPGAGAAWLSTAAVGDRLPVLGRQDIWYQVRWQEGKAFVRAADLLVID